ncbi:MAG: carbon monoxide dehydrogenase subunit G [Rhodospirillaceae bacterium]|nr:carbon monoxide dehydrogenase subunit G [Rhodospirillaceae bacterium]
MELTGQERIAAPRTRVWQALNDPEILKACIPGCESIEVLSPTEMKARVALKLGPIKASFSGRVTLSDIDPPNGYSISGEGSGGSAGGARGSAQVRLADDGDHSLLSYRVTSQVTGKIAQLGARLVDSAAQKLAGDFFGKFRETVSAPPAADVAASAPPLEAAPAAAPSSSGPSPWRWFIAFSVGTSALIVWIWFSAH